MDLKEKYKDDIEFLMSKRAAQGADYWASPGPNIGKGSPFSTRDAGLILAELGFGPRDKVVNDMAEMIFSLQRPDGRFRIAPSGGMYPCQTIGVLRLLCYLGYQGDERLKSTLRYMLESPEHEGGWKCNKFSFGRGPDTLYPNPGPTLEALDALRFFDPAETAAVTEPAVEFLLWHRTYKKPVGPCFFGMGSLFHKTEFPFFRYNLFYYTFVLSFYDKARQDPRFMEAFNMLKTKLYDGKMVVENPNRRLAGMAFCFKGKTSDAATRRYLEIEKNMAG
jgi:hypothetical protein